MTLLAIDPGTTESGWVVLDDDNQIVDAGVQPNDDMLTVIRLWRDDTAIERFEARGNAIGDDSIETIIWTGRFIQASRHVFVVRRSAVKSYLCGTQSAKDTNIRQALIDLIGPPGTKRNPGPTYGVTKHAWAALGVAATVRKLERKDTTT
jgi:hypothetical protein